MRQAAINVKHPILSQTQFCAVVGADMVTVNNWVARKVLTPTEIGGRQIKGTRLYSMSSAYAGRIIAELVRHHKIPPSDAAMIAELATKGGWIEHWARALEGKGKFVPAYMLVAWRDDCYESQIVNGDKDDLPDLSVKEAKPFLGHPFIVLPLTTLFFDVFSKCKEMLMPEKAFQ